MMPKSPPPPATLPPTGPGASIRTMLAIAALAALLLGVGAGANRLPILFPDTIGYNRAGEAIYTAMAHASGRRDATPGPARPAAPPVAPTAPAPDDDGVSTARSPYYGFALASLTRLGGVWLAASVQALIVAAALVLGMRHLGLSRPVATGATAVAATLGGLGFFAGVLLPDVFLGPVILALALLLTGAPMPRRERWFWLAVLVAGLLFHRAFVATAVVVVVAAAAVFYRARWFDRRGWRAAAAACAIAVAGHALIGVAIADVLHKPIRTPPFVLARMAGGAVLTAYLDDACPARPFLLCRYRARLPMPSDRFLWYPDAAGGIWPGLSPDDKQRLNAESGTIVAGAVAARPVAAIAEAAGLSVEQFFAVGVDEFGERVGLGGVTDPAMVATMPAYRASGIVTGGYSLPFVSGVVTATYLAALAALGLAGAVLAAPRLFGRMRRPVGDRKAVAIVAIIVGALVANAVTNATLAGVFARYEARVAWLAVIAAAVAWSAVARSTARPPHPVPPQS